MSLMTKMILFGKENTENNKMSINSLNTIKDTIYTIMVKYPATRDSDELLYLKVCEYYNPTVLNKSFKQVFVNRLFNGIPSFETVRRCRTKVQSEHEELHSTLEVKQKRQKARRVFIEWAKI